jgi:hypothetical protein
MPRAPRWPPRAPRGRELRWPPSRARPRARRTRPPWPRRSRARPPRRHRRRAPPRPPHRSHRRRWKTAPRRVAARDGRGDPCDLAAFAPLVRIRARPSYCERRRHQTSVRRVESRAIRVICRPPPSVRVQANATRSSIVPRVAAAAARPLPLGRGWVGESCVARCVAEYKMALRVAYQTQQVVRSPLRARRSPRWVASCSCSPCSSRGRTQAPVSQAVLRAPVPPLAA